MEICSPACQELLAPRLRPGEGGGGDHEAEAHLNPPGVRLEAPGGVFGRHPALDGAAVHPDLVLFEVELGQAAALAHVQLSVHQVHTVEERREMKQVRRFFSGLPVSGFSCD